MSHTKRDDLNNANSVQHIRTPYNYNRNALSMATSILFTEPTLTQQHEQDETDINLIVQKFGVTGMLPQARTLPTYGDFFAAGDYQTSLNLIKQAQDAFLDLPARVRAQFDHDPANFVAFIDSKPDGQVLLDLGLGHLVPETKSDLKISSKDETTTVNGTKVPPKNDG